nr:Gag protein [Tanacetum cinerariifolium]
MDDGTTPVANSREGPSGSTSVVKIPIIIAQNQTIAAKPLSDLGDPIMQFIVHNFDQINAMYIAFSSKRKEITQQQIPNSLDDPLVISSGQSTFEGVASGANNMITEKYESLKDYLARFGKETLHMTDRSDGKMTGAFISGLRPGRLFLRTTRALIDVYGEETILRDGDERLTLNMKHDTASYSNHPHRESVNLINIFNLSSEDCLEDLVSNKLSGNPTLLKIV